MVALRPGSTVTLTIDRLSLGGEGVARFDGRVVFVPDVAPGDEVEVQISELRDRFAKARVTNLLKASRDRIVPPCSYHPRAPSPGRPLAKSACGGCGWQQIQYAAQLRIKTDLVRETLERLGGLKGITVKPTLGMKDPWRYRNKVQQPVGYGVRPERHTTGARPPDSVAGGSDPSRGLISGFYATGSHDIVPIEDCRVQPELSVRIINRAKTLLDQHHARAYDARRHNGWIRHLLMRTSSRAQALLTFVTATPDFPHESKIIPTLLNDFPELVGVHQNVNPGRTNVILGRQWRKIAGADYLEEQLGHLKFRLSPASFFQVNSPQAEVLYNVTRQLAGSGERLLDLYTGVGTIALWLADRFKEVGGIEEIRAAIEDANHNADLNGIDNVRFEAAPVEAFLRGIPRSAGGAGLTVVLDPPRAGCDPGVLQSLLSLRPSSLVYVSCDPGTLARDLGVLTRGGYRVTEVQPVDMFPHTPHIETVVRLITAESRRGG